MSVAVWALLAAGAAGSGLLLATAPGSRLARPSPWVGRTPLGVLAAAVGLLLAAFPARGALVAVIAVVGVAAHALLRRRARRRATAAHQAHVLEACDLVAAELAAGIAPSRALRRAADGWPHLEQVAVALDLGGDVPAAWRAAAELPGAEDLRLVGAAWSVAHRTGHGLADALGRCADALRAARSTRRVVESELASARATARLVAGLPVVALAMGSGTGGDPIGFLLGTPGGLACLAAGLALGIAGLWWIESIADDVGRGA